MESRLVSARCCAALLVAVVAAGGAFLLGTSRPARREAAAGPERPGPAPAVMPVAIAAWRFDDARLRRALDAGDDRAVDDALRERLDAGFARALASLDALTGDDRTRTGDLCCRLVRRLVGSDAEHAREILRAAYGSPLPPAIVDACYAELAARQPFAELAAAIVTLADPAEQHGAARQLLVAWGRSSPDAALAWSEKHRAILDDAAIGALVETVGRTQPRAALEFLVAQAGTFAHPLHWEMQMSDLVARNATPANALDLLLWSADLPLETTAWNNLVKQLFARVRDADAATALGFAHNVRDPHLRDELLSASAHADWVAGFGETRGLAALSALFDDPVHQSAAVARAVEAIAARTLAPVVSQIENLPAGPIRNAAIFAAIPFAAQRDPGAFDRLVSRLSGPTELRQEIVAEALRRGTSKRYY